MRILNHDFNRTSSCDLAIAFYALCGLLLLLWPDLALGIANYALAAVLLAVGGYLIVSYVRGSVIQGVLGLRLTIGLAFVFVGVLLLFSPSLLQAVLPFMWGLSLLAGGFGKVQMSADLKRIGAERWWVTLAGALISFVLGAIAVFRPTFVAEMFIQFIGVSLLVEGALDMGAMLTINKKIRDFRKEHQKTIEV